MTTFQARVNRDIPLGVEGNFASDNPYSTVTAPNGAFVAGADGVVIGRFAWVQDDGITVLNVPPTSTPDAMPYFVPRAGQALVLEYEGQYGMTIPAGREISLMKKGDFFAKATVAEFNRGDDVYASSTDGTVQSAAPGGSAPSGTVKTGFKVENPCAVGELATISA